MHITLPLTKAESCDPGTSRSASQRCKRSDDLEDFLSVSDDLEEEAQLADMWYRRLMGQAVAIAAASAVANNGMKRNLSAVVEAASIVETILEDPTSIHRDGGTMLGSETTVAQIVSIYSRSYKLVWYLVLGLLCASLLAAAMMKSYSLHREDDEEYKEAAKEYLDERRRRGRKAKDDQQGGDADVRV